MGIVEDMAKPFWKEFFGFLGSIFRRKRKMASEVFGDFIMINDIANELIDAGIGDCFFLIRAHNGNAKLSLESYKYRSIVAGANTDFLMPDFRIKDFKNIELDLEYMQTLHDIARYKNLGIDVQTEKGSSGISHRFNNLKYVRYYFLNENQYGMWYCMVGTTQPDEQMNDTNHTYKLNMAINKVKNIVRSY